MARRTVYRHRPIVIIGLLMVFGVSSLALECTAPPTVPATSIRSSDFGLDVTLVGVLLATPLPDADDAKNKMNAQIQSTNGRVSIAGVTFNDNGGPPPHSIGLQFTRVDNYTIYANDTVTLSFDATFFRGGVSCPPINVTILKSPGVLKGVLVDKNSEDLEKLDEDSVNKRDTTYALDVDFDQFTGVAVSTLAPLHPFIRITYLLDRPPPTSRLLITVKRNESFNIDSTVENTIRFVLSASMMRTGLAPSMPDSASESHPALVLIGIPPFIDVKTGIPGNELYSEDLWDGTAVVALVLVGDTWSRDISAWYDPIQRPIFTAQKPIQRFSFSYFLSRGVFPNVTISSRVVWLKFPPLVGFTLSLVTDALEISRFNRLTKEQTSISTVSVRILLVRWKKPQIFWSSPILWTDPRVPTVVSETVVRRSAITFTMTCKYTVFVFPPPIGDIIRMFSLSPGAKYSVTDLQLTHNDTTNAPLTQITVTIPSKPQYDITSKERINITVSQLLLENKVTTQGLTNDFYIGVFTGTGTCALELPAFLNESTIRDLNGPPIDFNISIISGEDTFLYSDGAIAQLKESIDTPFENPTKYFAGNITVVSVNPKKITLRIAKDVGFQLNADAFVGLSVPAELMGSLEACRAFPSAVAPNPISFLQFSIRAMPGRIIGAFPTITEIDMRTQPVEIKIFFEGDTFFIGTNVVNGSFRPFFDVSPLDTSGRGFSSIVARTVIAYVTGNTSEATIRIPANETYDAAATETVFLRVDSALTTSRLVPFVSVTPLVITAVPGIITSNLTSWNTTITEKEVNQGTFRMSFRLQYERWDPTIVPGAVRQSIETTSPLENTGKELVDERNTIFSNAAFSYDTLFTTLTISLQPSASFDILKPAAFTFTFSDFCFASRQRPSSGNVTWAFTILPSGGQVSVSGTAANVGTIQVLDGGTFYVITLQYDLWIREADFDPKGLCVFPPSTSCTRVVSEDRRLLTVTFDANDQFSPPSNQTYNVTLKPEYFASGILPEGIINIFAYVTPGRAFLRLDGGGTSVSEDIVREGTWSGSGFIVSISGDRLSGVAELKQSLISSVSCELVDTTPGSANQILPRSVASPYGFCARASILFETVRFVCDSSTRRICTVVLQPDADFDVFTRERVTLRLGSVAVQSRLAPNASFVFTIEPSAGKFFFGTSFSSITARAINAPTPGVTYSVDLTLFGERWGLEGNSTEVTRALLPFVTSDSSQRETEGFDKHKGVIFAPTSSSTISPNGRVLTLTLLPAPAYTIFQAETVTISPPGSIMRSGLTPSLGSLTASFVIQPALASITSYPAFVSAAQIANGGANLTLSIVNDQWDTVALLDFALTQNAITSSSSPAAEPNGFTTNKATLLAPMSRTGPLINSSQLSLVLARVPTFALSKSEIVAVKLPSRWLTSKNLPAKFTYFFTLRPAYPVIEAVVKMPSFFAVLDLFAWRSAVAATLGVSVAQIQVQRVTVEPNLPAALAYQRVAFQVATEEAVARANSSGSTASDGTSLVLPNNPPAVYELYDNNAASIFINLDPAALRQKFNTSLAFFNDTPPSADRWAALAGVASTSSDDDAAIGLGVRYLLYISAGIVGLMIVAGVIVTIRSRASRPSQRWAPSSVTGGQATIERKHDEDGLLGGGDRTQAEDDVLAASLYAGQARQYPTLSINATTGSSPPSSIPLRNAVSRFDEDDDVDVGYDVPLGLYAGQTAAAKLQQERNASQGYGQHLREAAERRGLTDAVSVATIPGGVFTQPHHRDVSRFADLASAQQSELVSAQLNLQQPQQQDRGNDWSTTRTRKNNDKKIAGMSPEVERLLTLPPRPESQVIYPPLLDRSQMFQPPSKFRTAASQQPLTLKL